MNCLSVLSRYVSFALEQLGVYEPELDWKEAEHRLRIERRLWAQSQTDRDELWSAVQSSGSIKGPLPPSVDKVVTHLSDQGIRKGVAVDLGCGISTTTVSLLQRGWKVYAVDSSAAVLNVMRAKISLLDQRWIQEKQLVLVNQSI